MPQYFTGIRVPSYRLFNVVPWHTDLEHDVIPLSTVCGSGMKPSYQSHIHDRMCVSWPSHLAKCQWEPNCMTGWYDKESHPFMQFLCAIMILYLILWISFWKNRNHWVNLAMSKGFNFNGHIRVIAYTLPSAIEGSSLLSPWVRTMPQGCWIGPWGGWFPMLHSFQI